LILDRILREKELEVAELKRRVPLSELRLLVAEAARQRDGCDGPLDFAGALRRDARGLPAVVAEVKKGSPSKGIIREDFDPVDISQAYQRGGAAAVSVLTDEKFFMGSLDNLKRVKSAVNLPVLRKDFIIDEYQIYEARAAGADAVLLIVAALERARLEDLFCVAEGLCIAALVEVHDEYEMGIALSAGARLVGINNRNLQTFDVSLETTYRLVGSASGVKVVSESGISSRADLQRLGDAGVDAVLVGEALVRGRDVEAKLRELTE